MDELNLDNGDFIADGRDFDGTAGLDTVDIDKLLSGEEMLGSFNMHEADYSKGSFNINDSELLNLMSQDQAASLPEPDVALTEVLNLTSDSSIDNLVSMPLVELDGSLEPDPFAESPHMNSNSSMNHRMQQTQLNMNQMQHPQPHMNQMQSQHINMPQNMRNRLPHMNQHQVQRQQMHMSPNLTMSGNMQQMMAPAQNPGPRMFSPPPQRERQSSTTVEDLEREKLKLLSKLSEINKRQSQINETSNNMMPQGIGGEDLNQQQTIMMQQLNNIHVQQTSPAPQQQQQMMQQMGGMRQQHERPKPSLASAVAEMSVKDTGESPLTSFLRQKGGGGGGGSAVQNSGVRNSSASVFSAKPMAEDPFNRGQTPNLSGAMDRSTATHAMIKKLAFKTDGTVGRSAGRSAGRSGNATWGADSGKSQGYRYSGILPKHASDGHLLRASGLGSRGSKTSLSKDNLLYGLGRSKGRTSAQSKDSLHGLVKRGSSNRLSSNALKEDFGGAIPRKGRAGASKYKFGISGSVPQLGSYGQLRDPGMRGGVGDGGNQGNERW